MRRWGTGPPTWRGSTCTRPRSPPRCSTAFRGSRSCPASRPTGSCVSTPTTRPAGPPTPPSMPRSGAPPSGPPSTPRRPWASAPCTRCPAPRSPASTISPASCRSPPIGPARASSGTGGSSPSAVASPSSASSAWPAPGGDLFCDGAFGSHTAALSAPYRDRPETSGALRFETAQLVHHVRACTEAGIQAGFHVIGDAAVGQVLEAVGAVVDELGAAAVRACRHRLEHLEMLDDAAVQRLHAWGLVASVQPAFDAAWGGDTGMYAERLGLDRAAATNPFADLADAGVALALGSDAPVTPLDPWGGVHAAVDHRTAGSGLRPFDAFDAATHGGWYASRTEHPEGPLAVGAPADLALWDTALTLSAVLAGRGRPSCRLLLVGGRPIGDLP